MTVTVATFYAFFPFADNTEWREPLRATMIHHGLKGTILLAPEGLNATVSGPAEGIDALLAKLRTHPALPELDVKTSKHAEQPFGRALVKCKKEIIRFDYPLPDGAELGEHVDAETWNRLVDNPGVTVLDTRNRYETRIGTFKNATVPDIYNFTELKDFLLEQMPPDQHPEIATFCTGGVRCEKLTGWMKQQGYQKLYQLNGGILRYLEDTDAANSRWQGECFVFDERIAVDHELAASRQVGMCPACGYTLTEEDKQHEAYVPDEACPHCEGK